MKGGATELPSSAPPQRHSTPPAQKGNLQNLVKPPNHLNQTKQREKSLHINSTQLSIIEIEIKTPYESGCPIHDDG
ncbi:MAG TPA: hypothetical protein VIJ65_05725, partial [Acidobacteriaceae bacterium]